MKTKRIETAGKKWWAGLTDAEKDVQIAKWERDRKKNRKRGKDETWTNEAGTFTKVWTSDDSFTVTRIKPVYKEQPLML